MINYRLKAKTRNYGKTVLTLTRDEKAIDIFLHYEIIFTNIFQIELS